MGQQQLLLIVLGVIIVGIAVVVGIEMFGKNAAQANFDAVVSDMNTIAANAQSWYRKPTSMGGGGRDFSGIALNKIGFASSNTNGSYALSSIDASSFVVTGTGVEDGDADGTSATAAVTVYADSMASFSVTSY